MSTELLIAGTLVAFLAAISFLIFTHELGHFLAARALGIRVLEFAFGLPPRLLSFTSPKTHTRYSICAIPIGGFVRLLGEEEATSSPGSFSRKRWYERLAVIASGVLANFFVAWVLLTVVLWVGQLVPERSFVIIRQVLPGSVAAQAKLETGDLILAIDGLRPRTGQDVATFTKAHQGQDVRLVIRRFGRDREVSLTLASGEAPLGVFLDEARTAEEVPPALAPLLALEVIGDFVTTSIAVLTKAIVAPFTGQPPGLDISGPIGIFAFVSQALSMGTLFVLRLIAFLSIAVGFFNILPLPALDGGHFALTLAEGAFGRRILRPEIEKTIHFIGFILLIVFLLAVSARDIARLL